jgi:hypothetical protein
MRSPIKALGYFLIFVGCLLIAAVISNFPSGYWSQGEAEIQWYKIDGLEVVNGGLQFKYVQPGVGEPSSEELTQFAIQLDPSFFTGCPVNVMISLTDYINYPKGIQLATYLYTNGYQDLAGLLSYKLTTKPPHSGAGYIGAVASLGIGLLLVMLGRAKKK